MVRQGGGPEAPTSAATLDFGIATAVSTGLGALTIGALASLLGQAELERIDHFEIAVWASIVASSLFWISTVASMTVLVSIAWQTRPTAVYRTLVGLIYGCIWLGLLILGLTTGIVTYDAY